MSKWRPIATMPKDGQPFLVLSKDGHIGIAVASEVDYDGMLLLSQHSVWSGKRPMYRESGVWLGGDKPSDGTHWMPLPEPPSD